MSREAVEGAESVDERERDAAPLEESREGRMREPFGGGVQREPMDWRVVENPAGQGREGDVEVGRSQRMGPERISGAPSEPRVKERAPVRLPARLERTTAMGRESEALSGAEKRKGVPSGRMPERRPEPVVEMVREAKPEPAGGLGDGVGDSAGSRRVWVPASGHLEAAENLGRGSPEKVAEREMEERDPEIEPVAKSCWRRRTEPFGRES